MWWRVAIYAPHNAQMLSLCETMVRTPSQILQDNFIGRPTHPLVIADGGDVECDAEPCKEDEHETSAYGDDNLNCSEGDVSQRSLGDGQVWYK